MKKITFIVATIVLILTSCNSSKDNKELSEQEQHVLDSISKINQKAKADSLKMKNPLLIMPPDSNYTGDYTDKYPSGVIKFKGFFRFGERHGQWMSFYPTGILWSELNYDKGKRQGFNATYYLNSKKRYEGFYKNDTQDSVWIYYDTTGVINQKVLYKNDRVIQRLSLK
jgi:antitoxin component YwqK of YwqJK toxin-antitoxin module